MPAVPGLLAGAESFCVGSAVRFVSIYQVLMVDEFGLKLSYNRTFSFEVDRDGCPMGLSNGKCGLFTQGCSLRKAQMDFRFYRLS